MDTVMDLVGTAALAMLSVGLWTVRVALTARGSRVMGSSVAAVEATVFAAAFSRLLGDLDSPARIAAYGIGVAAGTLAGLWIDGWVRPSQEHEPGRPGAAPRQYVAGGSLAGKDSRPISSTSGSASGAWWEESTSPPEGAPEPSRDWSPRRLATNTSTTASAASIPSTAMTRSDFIPADYPPHHWNETSAPGARSNRPTDDRTARTPDRKRPGADHRGIRRRGTTGGASRQSHP